MIFSKPDSFQVGDRLFYLLKRLVIYVVIHQQPAGGPVWPCYSPNLDEDTVASVNNSRSSTL